MNEFIANMANPGMKTRESIELSHFMKLIPDSLLIRELVDTFYIPLSDLPLRENKAFSVKE